jgi:hypothetical protein
MRHRAALAGALATGACALIAGPGSAATVGILTSDAACCAISGGLNPQDDSAGTAKGESPAGGWPSGSSDPALANEVTSGGSDKADDSIGPPAIAVKDGGALDDNSPDAAGSPAAPEPSVLATLLMTLANLSASLFGSR